MSRGFRLGLVVVAAVLVGALLLHGQEAFPWPVVAACAGR
jgi:hypothetical protein